MSTRTASLGTRRPRWSRATVARAASGLALCSWGAVFLLARPSLWPYGAPALAAGYVVLLVVSVTDAASAPTPAPAGAVPVPLIAGMLAVALAWWLVGPGLPMHVSAVVVALDVLAAIAEEAFFRRFLFGRLERWGTGVAIAGSALAFAAIHVPLYGLAAFPIDLGAGLLFSWQRAASGRWSVPAATHVLANLMAVIP